MKPSVGRIVHVKHSPNIFHPAIVTEVMNETTINCTVFAPGASHTSPMSSVKQGEEIGNWNWPARLEA